MSAPIRELRLRELRFTTWAFINESPSWIKLYPSRPLGTTQTATLKPSGGYDYGDLTATPRAPQIFRLIDDTTTDAVKNAKHGDALEFEFKYTLVGMWDAIVNFGDAWDEIRLDGTKNHYHVCHIEPFNGYELRAHVCATAAEPTHG